MSIISRAVIWLAMPLTCAGNVYGDEPKTPNKPSSRRDMSALDAELLKDLGPDAEIDGLDTGPTKKQAADPAIKDGSAKKEIDPLEQELLKGLEDSDQSADAAGRDPLARLRQQMRDVEGKIAQRRADRDTLDRQTQIVKSIDDLIRQAQNQRQSGGQSSQSGSTGKGAQQTTKRRESLQPHRRTGESSDMSDAPARQSTKKTREQQAEKPDMANMRDLLKGVWGQLPERQREQMIQSYEEQFLPKYEQMIADYFRSLAEGTPGKP
ncbi:MAG TPA: hypothetical protein VGN12_10565 [Pirellulales bacterium]|jgi:hypothetical protein